MLSSHGKASHMQRFHQESANRFQKVWDTAASTAVYDDILTRCAGDADQARLKAANSPHTGDWLNAPPIACVGPRRRNQSRGRLSSWILHVQTSPVRVRLSR